METLGMNKIVASWATIAGGESPSDVKKDEVPTEARASQEVAREVCERFGARDSQRLRARRRPTVFSYRTAL
jgi:hypothetical protein